MKKLSEFDVNLFSLQNKVYEFDYQIKDSFFEAFEFSIIDNGNFSVKATLDRSERLIEAEFEIKGTVMLECDKSLKPFKFEIAESQKMIYKFTQEYEDVSETLIHLPFDHQQLNLAQPIYEFISMAIPMRKIHPDLVIEEMDDFDDEEDISFVYSSLDEEDELETPEEEETTEDGEEITDPRWEALKKLK
ncbi:MAG: DUF177 domain-containing protein [Cytophagales bacterium]|nr:DUF177 domain-containing protein [Cytophagales bacterium]